MAKRKSSERHTLGQANRTCNIPGCSQVHLARGWCRKHYLRWKTHGDPLAILIGDREASLADRLWSRVAKVDDATSCWEWLGGHGSTGYGELQVRGVRYGPHVAAWIITHGPIPEGQSVCHHCDNRGCCRPDHLFLGSQEDNIRDAVSKGRMPRGEQHCRSKLTEDDIHEVWRLRGIGWLIREIATELDVSKGAVQHVLHGRTWLTHDAEAVVIGHVAGKGRHRGRLGALRCRAANGKEFSVGSGFDDVLREATLFPVGTVVTYRYQELTNDEVPRFPTFLRKYAAV